MLDLETLFNQINSISFPPGVARGGEGGIRTLGRGQPTHAFQACALNRSATSPARRRASEQWLLWLKLLYLGNRNLQFRTDKKIILPESGPTSNHPYPANNRFLSRINFFPALLRAILTKKAENTSAYSTLVPTTIKACCILVSSTLRFKVNSTQKALKPFDSNLTEN